MTVRQMTVRPVTVRPVPALGVGLVVAVVDFVGLLPGWWWLSSVVAFLAALLLRGTAVFWWMVLGSLVGWTAMLLWHGGTDIGRIGNLVGELALNTTGLGWAVITATYLLDLLLTLTAGWLGRQVRHIISSPANRPPDHEPHHPSRTQPHQPQPEP